MTDRISIVIPCLNEAAHLPRALDAIAAQDLPPFEVLVVDAGSDDGSPEVVRTFAARHPHLGVRVIEGTWNAIPAVVNAGIKAARGEIIARLDGHSVPAPDYLRRVTLALAEAQAGVAGGIWRVVPGADTAVARAIACAVSHPLGAGDAAYRIATRAPGRSSVDTVPFGCFRRETWERFGGFNEGLLTNEDYEFNYRVRSSGLPVILDPSVECEYVARATLGALARQYFRYGWWKAQMLKANPSSLRLRQAIPALFAPGLIALALGALVSRWSLYALGTVLAIYFATLAGAGLALSRGSGVGARGSGGGARGAGLGARGSGLGVRGSGLGVRGSGALVVAFAIVHFVWSVGVLVNVLTRGQWPPWRRRHRAPRVAAARGFTAVGLVIALAAIAGLMLVPAVVAHRVHASRVARARAQVESVALVLRATAPRTGVAVLAGTGRAPDGAASNTWLVGTRDAIAIANLPPDPWGNQLLVNASAPKGAAMVVISAGPNGIIETDFANPASVGGDDIGARIR